MIDHSKDSGVFEKPNNIVKKAPPKMKSNDTQKSKEREGFSK